MTDKITNTIKKDILPLVETLKNNFNDNGVLFYVGGYLRNNFINQIRNKNIKIKDIDLATNIEPDILKELLNKKGYRTIDTGIEHGTFTLLLPLDNDKYEALEITTFRKDVATNGRKRTISYRRTIEEDLERRDFTVNAIAKNVRTDEILDPFNGINDIKNMNLKFVLNPKDRIKEDELRVLRYFRFIFQLNFNIDDEILEIIKNNFDINILSNERIKSELEKILLNINEKNFDILNILFDNKILFSNILLKELFDNFIKHKEQILKTKNKTFLNLSSFINIDKDILKKLKFSNVEIKEIEIFSTIRKNLSLLVDKTNLKLFLFVNNIEIDMVKKFSIDNNIKLLNIINEIELKKEVYSQKSLDIDGNDIEYHITNVLKIKNFDKKIIGDFLKYSVKNVILNKSNNKKEILLKDLNNFILNKDKTLELNNH